MPNFGKPVKGSAKVAEDPSVIERQNLQALELRRKQEILLRTRLQELMEEEEAMCRTSEKDIQCRWTEWLRAEKHKELTGEIEIIRHTFEKTLDRKNAVIQMLIHDMEEAEEQYRLALRTHIGTVDSLIDLQNRRMTDLDIEFENDLLRLKSDFELERAEIQKKHDLEKADLKLVLENMAAEADREDRKLQEETSESHDTAIEKMDEEKKQMQGELAKISQHLRQQINEKFDEFVNNATVNMKEYMELTKSDEETAEKIASQMRKIQKLQENIATWKSNLSNNIRECEERNTAMRLEKETTARHFKELKMKMQRWRLQQEKRLAELVSQARDSKQGLTEQTEHAERILRLVELCNELETEREKLLAFDSDVSSEEVAREVTAIAERLAQAKGANNDSPNTPMTVEQMFPDARRDDGTATAGSAEEWRLLERFWVKYSKVVIDNAAIAQERFHLQQENAKLRSLLKQYLDGISVNHDVMSQKNNLLQTGKVKTVLSLNATTDRTPHAQVTDGNKIVMDIVRQRDF